MKNTIDIRDQFPKGMKVQLINTSIELHRARFVGRIGIVEKAVKSRNIVRIRFPEGDRYDAFPENVCPV